MIFSEINFPLNSTIFLISIFLRNNGKNSLFHKNANIFLFDNRTQTKNRKKIKAIVKTNLKIYIRKIQNLSSQESFVSMSLFQLFQYFYYYVCFLLVNFLTFDLLVQLDLIEGIEQENLHNLINFKKKKKLKSSSRH